MPAYAQRRELAAAAPQVEIIPHGFIAQFSSTLAAGGSEYIKQASVIGATSPTSDEWILATKAVLSWFIFTNGTRGASLIVEIDPMESGTFFPWKAPFAILWNVPNDIVKLEIPASKAKFKLVNASTTNTANVVAWLKIQGVA